MVSAIFFSGSRPETKVSEQITLARKPVATFGTSRARTAVMASAVSAVVAARAKIIRRWVITVSGWNTRQPQATARAAALTGFENRPRRRLDPARRFRKYSA